MTDKLIEQIKAATPRHGAGRAHDHKGFTELELMAAAPLVEKVAKRGSWYVHEAIEAYAIVRAALAKQEKPE